MLEVHSHSELKLFLQRGFCPWPHNLTLSRLIARSLRRRDNTMIQLGIGSQDFWWPGLLVPLNLSGNRQILVLSPSQKRRFFKDELPKLNSQGLNIPCWEDIDPSFAQNLWVIDFKSLIDMCNTFKLDSIFPDCLTPPPITNILFFQGEESEEGEVVRDRR